MSLLDEIRLLRQAKPFVPFKIRDTVGREFWVPTWDYVAVPPPKNRVVVFIGDDGTFITLTESKIDSLEMMPVE
jgi:hypothetical protein